MALVDELAHPHTLTQQAAGNVPAEIQHYGAKNLFARSFAATGRRGPAKRFRSWGKTEERNEKLALCNGHFPGKGTRRQRRSAARAGREYAGDFKMETTTHVAGLPLVSSVEAICWIRRRQGRWFWW